MTLDITPYRDTILAAFPDLQYATLCPLTTGWHSLAIDADDRLIFKFPRNAEAEQALRREARILAAVRPHLTLPVPDLHLIEGQMPFSRHAKIKGEHLLCEHYERLSVRGREALAEDLALFHAELHAMDVATVRGAGAAPILPWRSQQEIREKALPLLARGPRLLCERTLAAHEAMGRDPLGTVYGFFDGHGWNMAFDHERQRLNGVYDFADSGFGPLHQDFVYSAFISLELTGMIARRYARLTGSPIDHERIGVLIGMHRLSELAELADNAQHVAMALDHLTYWADNLTDFRRARWK